MITEDQVNFIVNKYVRRFMVEQGTLPTPTQVQSFLDNFRVAIGTPMMLPRTVSKGYIANPDHFNTTWEEVGDDLDILFNSARTGAVDILSNFQFNHIQFQNLGQQAHGVRRDVNTLMLVNDRSTGMLDHIYEDFNDLGNVDTGLTTAEVDIKRRIVRMGSAGTGSKLRFEHPESVVVKATVTQTMEGKGVSAVSFDLAPGSTGPESIFNDLLNDFWGMVVNKVTDGPVTWKIEVTLPMEVECSRVTMDVRSRKNFDASLTTADKNGKETFRGQISTQGFPEWRFVADRVRKLTVVTEQTFASMSGKLYSFFLIIANMSIFLDTVKNESDLYTKRMVLGFDNKVGRVSLVTEHEGLVDWYVKLGYEDADGKREESPSWLPIVPSSSGGQGDPVVLGSLSEKQARTIQMSCDKTATISEAFEAGMGIARNSMQVVPGLNLWRIDYVDVPLVSGRYRPSPRSIDLSIAHASFLPSSAIPKLLDDGGTQPPLEMFHRYRLSTLVYLDPAAFTDGAYKVKIQLGAFYEALVGADAYASPVLEAHTVDSVNNTIVGIGTTEVKLDKTAIKFNLDSETGHQWSGDITLAAGINYIVLYIDTGLSTPAFSQDMYERFKYKRLKLSFCLERGANFHMHDIASHAADFMMAGPADPADGNPYRTLVPISKLEHKLMSDFLRAAIEEYESPDARFFRVFLNHPYMAFEFLTIKTTGAAQRPAPYRTLTDILAYSTELKCRVSYRQVERLVNDVTLWAHMRKGDVLPVIKNFSLRFAL